MNCECVNAFSKFWKLFVFMSPCTVRILFSEFAFSLIRMANNWTFTSLGKLPPPLSNLESRFTIYLFYYKISLIPPLSIFLYSTNCCDLSHTHCTRWLSRLTDASWCDNSDYGNSIPNTKLRHSISTSRVSTRKNLSLYQGSVGDIWGTNIKCHSSMVC